MREGPNDFVLMHWVRFQFEINLELVLIFPSPFLVQDKLIAHLDPHSLTFPCLRDLLRQQGLENTKILG
jgi:hypothetical protein